MLLRQYCQWHIMAHGHHRLCCSLCHGEDLIIDLFIGVAKYLIHLVTGILIEGWDLLIRNLQFIHMEEIHIQPLTVWLSRSIGFLHFLIWNQALRLRIN